MKLFSLLVAAFGGATMVGGQPYDAATMPFQYMDNNGTALLGHMAMPGTDGPNPAIVIIPDWDGVNEYEQIRATMVAREWGFVGFAADIYGVMPQTVANITERRELATFYRSNPEAFAARIHAAIEAVKSMPQVDSENVALFGYCFGGTGVLQYGLHGNDDVNAIVSFHGGLAFFPEVPEMFGPKVLVLDGGDDNSAEQIMDLEILMDTAEAPWEITRYSDIQHAFTVWFDDRYDEFVDMRTWEAAGTFVLEAFGIVPQEGTLAGTTAATVPVDYTGSIDSAALRGHLAMPDESWERPLSAVVVLPDWDGVNTYEQQRATALAEMGYVAMAADIFGADKQDNIEVPERIELITKYSTDPALYVARINDAIDQLKMVEGVDPNEIGLIGYCFGGSGAVLYSFFDGSGVKVAVAFHGSFTQLPPVMVDTISPYLLILSGGDDGLHGNQTTMETAFASGNADWEITRYAGLGHGYTAPMSPDYSLTGDVRSWESMLSAFEDLMAIPQKAAPTPAPEDSGSDVPSAGPGRMTASPTASPSIATSTPAPVETPEDNMSEAPTMVDDSSAYGIIGVWKAAAVAAVMMAAALML